MNSMYFIGGFKHLCFRNLCHFYLKGRSFESQIFYFPFILSACFFKNYSTTFIKTEEVVSHTFQGLKL